MVSLLDDLVAYGAIRFGDFTLTSGQRSHYYVDVKAAATRPDLLRRMTGALAPHVEGHDRIAGMELGAVPLVVALALETDVPYVILRKEARAHGTGRPVEGELGEGDRVLLVEDVVTTGSTLGRAVETLRRRGAVVEKAVCVVDREEGGAALLERTGVALVALVRARDLLGRAGP